MSDLIKFESRTPSAQTAVDVFRDRWACNLQPLLGVDGTGPNLLFTQDKRPEQAARALGRTDFDGFDILEIGPLEAAHTWILEKMAARSVTCVESSVEAWLKCLIVKEILDLKRSKFLLGDVIAYLEEEQRRFDLVFCSGVLYHMSDPVRLIRDIAGATDRCFVWTHVYHPDRQPVAFQSSVVERDGFKVRYWAHQYGTKLSQFWGGNKSTAVWMSQEDLFTVFSAYGLSDIELVADHYNHPNGPSVTFCAKRPEAVSATR